MSSSLLTLRRKTFLANFSRKLPNGCKTAGPGTALDSRSLRLFLGWRAGFDLVTANSVAFTPLYSHFWSWTPSVAGRAPSSDQHRSTFDSVCYPS